MKKCIFLAAVLAMLLAVGCSTESGENHTPSGNNSNDPNIAYTPYIPSDSNGENDTTDYIPTEPTDPIDPTEPDAPIGEGGLRAIRLPSGDLEGADARASAFLHNLGYNTHILPEFLRSGSDWVAITTDETIRNFRVIQVIPYYDGVYNNGWRFTRHYSYTWTRETLDLLHDVPLVFAWDENEWSVGEAGLTGVAYTDENGRERTFLLRRRYDDAIILDEFESTERPFGAPQFTIFYHGLEQSRLVITWITEENPASAATPARDAFLSQFDSYTIFASPYPENDPPFHSWLIFEAEHPLNDFKFFTLGHMCDPWMGNGYGWNPFYVDRVIDTLDVLWPGSPVAMQWAPVGTMPAFGIGFTDSAEWEAVFHLNSNNASGFPPIFIGEFFDRGYCPDCR